MREDIYIWLTFLDNFNCITSYELVDWLNDLNLELFTDSAGVVEYYITLRGY